MKRLASLDALRGFDMFFITGGAGLITALATLCAGKECWLAAQMEHVPWAGFHHHDTIFPLFLFLAGVSWPFSLAAQREKGRSDAKIHLKILVRTAILFALGMSLGGIQYFEPNFRIPSVLGFIGISWGLSALVFMHVEKLWQRAAILTGLVLGYFALLHFGGAPGPEGYEKLGNVLRAIDLKVMSGHLYVPGVYDPESLMAIPGGMIVALLGMGAGTLLRDERLAGGKKAGVLFGCAAVSLMLALFFVYVLKVPMVKALWNVSFDFAALAYSFAMLALFYWVVDVLGFRKWTVLFDPIGKNSILVYMCGNIGIWNTLTKFCFTGVSKAAEPYGDVVWHLGYYSLALLLAWYCREKKVFLKV